jgi:hypothetical protein
MSQPDFTTVCENLLNAHPSILLYTCSNSSLSEEMFMNTDIYTHHKTLSAHLPVSFYVPCLLMTRPHIV